MSLKKALCTATAMTLVAGAAFAASHSKSLTIAIVNNGHMINMQKVAEAYTEETGVELNWVSLEEGVLREQVTSDTATGGGQYDIINIGMQEAPIWGQAGWIEPLNFYRRLRCGRHSARYARWSVARRHALCRSVLRRILDGYVPR